jgi:hypothetical protein
LTPSTALLIARIPDTTLQAEATGQTVLSPTEAKRLVPQGGRLADGADSVDLDGRHDDDPTGRTGRTLRTGTDAPIVLARAAIAEVLTTAARRPPGASADRLARPPLARREAGQPVASLHRGTPAPRAGRRRGSR